VRPDDHPEASGRRSLPGYLEFLRHSVTSRMPAGGTGTIIAATEPPWAVELWRWTLHPGERFGGDPHTPASKEMIWVESGAVTLTVAGRAYQVGTGQCARFPGSLPHHYAHAGTEPTLMTMICVVPPPPS
jgi:mannose-6-phosphate isomerase-like protein (cupin superfamily)